MWLRVLRWDYLDVPRQAQIQGGNLEFRLQSLFWVGSLGAWHKSTLLTRFEQKENGHLAKVKVEEVVGFVCHVITEAPPLNTVPGEVRLVH